MKHPTGKSGVPAVSGARLHKTGGFRLVASILTAAIGITFAGCARSRGIELNFIEVLTSPARTAQLRAMIAAYEEGHPGLRVNLISPPYEQADAKLAMMLDARQSLDIIEVRDVTAKQHVADGALEDLESRLAGWEDAKTLLPIARDAARSVDGKARFIPQFLFAKALFLRTDLLAARGIVKMPETLTELYADCAKVTDPAANHFGFALRGRNNPYRFSDILILSDIPDVDPTNMYRKKDGGSVFDDPRFLEGLRGFVALFAKAAPRDAVNWGFNEQVSAFVSGIAPFLVQDSDTVPLLDAQLGRDKYTVIPMPRGASGAAVLDYGYSGLGLVSYSKHKDEAWDFIAYMASAANDLALARSYGALPVHSSAYDEGSWFSSGVLRAWASTMRDTAGHIFVRYPFGSEKLPAWGKIQEKSMQAVLLGSLSPEDAVKQWATYWRR